MSDFDEISRAIGRIEGKLEKVEQSQNEQWKKLDKIENTLTAHRLKVIGISGTISAGVAAVYHLLKGAR
ncbi:MAG: hypothetical protein HY883_02825 [Deltaproteobacteria bacterium]|nr:hypothetical protein [Deltaproteobacteria bacterium]